MNVLVKILDETGEEPKVIFIFKDENEDLVYEKEKEIILKIGRICEKNGPLTNFESGGNKNKNISTVQKINLSIRARGKNHASYIHIPIELEKEIIKSYCLEKKTIKFISITFNLTWSKIRRILIENNVELSNKRIYPKTIVEENTQNKIVFDYNNRLSIREIHEKYKISYKVVNKILKEKTKLRKTWEHFDKKERIERFAKMKKQKGCFEAGEGHFLYKKMKEEQVFKMLKLRVSGCKHINYISKEIGFCEIKISYELSKFGLSGRLSKANFWETIRTFFKNFPEWEGKLPCSPTPKGCETKSFESPLLESSP